MKPLIVYCSRTGNTLRLVQAIATILDAEIMPAETAASEDFANRPLIGLASGIYWIRQDASLFRAVELIPKESALFLITSSGFQNAFFKWAYSLLFDRKLKRLGLNVVGRFHCPGQDRSPDPLFRWLKLSSGRPNAEDIVSAENFARSLIISS